MSVLERVECMTKITIYFLGGKVEEHYCDYYKEKNGLLTYYIGFGLEYNIPCKLIEKYVIER